jgi:hypothetical protein
VAPPDSGSVVKGIGGAVLEGGLIGLALGLLQANINKLTYNSDANACRAFIFQTRDLVPKLQDKLSAAYDQFVILLQILHDLQAKCPNMEPACLKQLRDAALGLYAGIQQILNWKAELAKVGAFIDAQDCWANPGAFSPTISGDTLLETPGSKAAKDLLRLVNDTQGALASALNWQKWLGDFLKRCRCDGGTCPSGTTRVVTGRGLTRRILCARNTVEYIPP